MLMRTIEVDPRAVDLRTADAAAVRGSALLVARVADGDLGRRTPCAGWDLAMLLEHMTTQHRGFAAAAEGRGADPAVWRLTPGPSVVERYASSAAEVIAAFAAPDVFDRPFTLPEFGTGRPFPGRLAVGFHLVDYVVHGWDVARSLGLPYRPPAEVLALTLPIARAVPGGSARLAEGAAFAPEVAAAAGSDPLTEILTLLGRDPGWHTPQNVVGHG
jgi:uncharacterized protein (TIGR03086 family)